MILLAHRKKNITLFVIVGRRQWILGEVGGQENGNLSVMRAATSVENSDQNQSQTWWCGQTAQRAVYPEELTVCWEDAADEAYERKMLTYS